MAALRQAMSDSKVVGINANTGEHANCDERNQQAKSKSVTHRVLLRLLTSRTVWQRVVKKL
jgi:hypothetical protein